MSNTKTVAEQIRKQKHIYICLVTHFRSEDTQTESEGIEKDIPCKCKELWGINIYMGENRLFLSFLAAPQHMDFLGQGSDPRHSCNLCYSCTNIRSFNPLCQAGD